MERVRERNERKRDERRRKREETRGAETRGDKRRETRDKRDEQALVPGREKGTSERDEGRGTKKRGPHARTGSGRERERDEPFASGHFRSVVGCGVFS